MNKITNRRLLWPLTFIVLMLLSIILYLLNSGDKDAVPDISCKAKGVLSVNGLTLNYVNAYLFSKDGTGASSVNGTVSDKHGDVGVVGMQIYFDYRLQSGLVAMKTTRIITQVENTVSPEIVRKLFPPIYYEVGSEHRIGIFKMGSGYRIDYNAFPINYCY